jgi:predicted secreted hydrolase
MKPVGRVCSFGGWLRGWLVGWLVAVISMGYWAYPAEAATTRLSWLDTSGADRAGFEMALAPRKWQFPEDFGPHQGYQTEWWYYTGNLETEAGRPFGFQLTFFRQALSPQSSVNIGSNWRSNQIYSAHFTVSDIAEKQFYPQERFSRGAVGLAGAEADPYQVWLENWSAKEVEPLDQEAEAEGKLKKVRLQAESRDVAIDLVVQQMLPPILQGDKGLSIKGLEPGNASYYYSLVQQPTIGSITVKGQIYQVSGLTWKDHEYSTSSLGAGTVGWDWFSMQFDDGAALMLYLLRHEDGTLEPTSAGMFIAASGETTSLRWQDWQIRVLDHWKSSRSGGSYPAKWELEIPKLELTLQAQPLMPDQELNVTTATYWEGAVDFKGTRQGKTVNGKGYVELTGYAGRLDTLLSARTP